MVERQLPKLKARSATAEEANACDGTPATPSSTPSSRDGNPPVDADLRRLIDAWPELPAVVRAGILAMVEAVKRGGG